MNRWMRWASLIVTDRRWAAPISAVALGFGLFVGVAIGPGTAGTLATGASQIIEIPALGGGGAAGGGGGDGGGGSTAALAAPAGGAAGGGGGAGARSSALPSFAPLVPSSPAPIAPTPPTPVLQPSADQGGSGSKPVIGIAPARAVAPASSRPPSSECEALAAVARWILLDVSAGPPHDARGALQSATCPGEDQSPPPPAAEPVAASPVYVPAPPPPAAAGP